MSLHFARHARRLLLLAVLPAIVLALPASVFADDDDRVIELGQLAIVTGIGICRGGGRRKQAGAGKQEGGIRAKHREPLWARAACWELRLAIVIIIRNSGLHAERYFRQRRSSRRGRPPLGRNVTMPAGWTG